MKIIVFNGAPINMYEIKDYKGYFISKCGLIYSEAKNNGMNRNGMFLKVYDKDGYKRVALTKDKKTKHFYLHRLLMETFVDNPNGYPIINHKNGNPSDNNLENLEWCTQQHNVIHAFETGLAKGLYGENNPAAKLNTNDVENIKKEYLKVKSSRKIAKKYNVCKSTILRIINGQTWNEVSMLQ